MSNINGLSNEELAVEIQNGHDQDGSLILVLWQQVEWLALCVGRRYGRGVIEEDDLYQICFLSLYPAIQHFEPALGSFSTILCQWTKQAVLRYLDNCGGVIRVPVFMRSLMRRYKKFSAEYFAQHGDAPKQSDIMQVLNISDQTYHTLMDALSAAGCSSLAVPIAGTEDGDVLVGDTIPDPADIEESVTDNVMQQELSEALWQQVDSLQEQQAAVIRMRYQDDMTLKEVGQQLGITPEAVRMKQKTALRELKKPPRAKHLKPFIEDELRSMALNGNGVGTFNRTWTSSTERAALMLNNLEEELKREMDELMHGSRS